MDTNSLHPIFVYIFIIFSRWSLKVFNFFGLQTKMPKACGTWCFPKHGTELRRHLGWCIRCHFKHLSPGLVGISSFFLSKIRCEPRVWFMFHVIKCGVLTPNMAEPFWDWWIVIFCWPIDGGFILCAQKTAQKEQLWCWIDESEKKHKTLFICHLRLAMRP